jgi:hypothetical protein
MTYVWITETDGKKRFVDDKYISPCRKCGESVSVCRATSKCEDDVVAKDVMCLFCEDNGCNVCEQDDGCQVCDSDRGCCCDAMYEAHKDSLLE